MIKYSIVTMVFNNYDLLREPKVVDENAEYVCITDNKELRSDVWKIRYMPALDTDKLSGIQKTYIIKYAKFLNFISNESKYVIRVDASVQINQPLTPIIEYLDNNNHDALLLAHTHRDDFIEEYKIWVTARKYDIKNYEKFLRYMSEKQFNINHTGLIECTIQIFRISDTTVSLLKEMGDLLATQVQYNDQDQCWFTYLFSKYDDKLNTCFSNISILASSFMDLCAHNNPNPYIKRDGELIVRDGKVIDKSKLHTAKILGKERVLKIFE